MAKPKTFTHLFGGYHSATAYHWKNPDGSRGGIVAVDASVHPTVTLPESVVVWPAARIAEGVSSIGYGSSIGKGCSIGARSYIGEGCSIGARSYIGEGCSIGDGSSIGNGSSIGARSSIGSDCSIGNGSSIGARCSIGNGTVYDAGDWLFVAGPQGSRHAFATVVWSPKHGLRWWLGCQQGITTDVLRARVQRDHANNPKFLADYLHLITTVETHPGLSRAMARKTT